VFDTAQNELLTLLKSDYTRSYLLPVKRGATAELITLDQAEEQRQDLLTRLKAKDARILELVKQLEDIRMQDGERVEELEKKSASSACGCHLH
jgi:ribosomal protein L9